MNPKADTAAGAAVPSVLRMEGLRLLLPAFVAVALVAASWLVHYPGSVPAGWDHSDGSISSVTARTVQGRKLYYPRVEYLALGYSY